MSTTSQQPIDQSTTSPQSFGRIIRAKAAKKTKDTDDNI